MAITGLGINGLTGTLNGNSIADETGALQISVNSGYGIAFGQMANPAGRSILYLSGSNIVTPASVSIDDITGLTSNVQIQLNRREVSLFDDFADANNGTTVETDMYSHTLAAGQLSANGDKLFIRIGGIFTGAATSTQELKYKFAGNTIFDSGALSIGAVTSNWDLTLMIIRESSTVIRVTALFTSDNVVLNVKPVYTRVTGLTLSGTNIVKATGQAAGVAAASNQITAKLGNVSYLAH